MKIVEAAELLVEILKECTKLDGCTLALMPPKPLITVAEGYMIHIDSDPGVNKETLACVESIAKKHDLNYFEDAKGIMIYRMH